MRTFLIIILTALLTLIGAGVVIQEGLIPGFGAARTTTQVVKTYEQGACEIKDQGESCTTPWGTSVDHGTLVLSFENEAGSVSEGCEAKTSICNDGAFLDGDEPLPYEKCTLETPGHCTVNGFVFAHGTSKTFYTEGSIENGTVTCDSQERSCNDGEANGDDEYIYIACHNFDQGACIVEDDQEATDDAEDDQADDTDQGTQQPTSNTNQVSNTQAAQTTTSSQSPQPLSDREPNCPSPRGGTRWEPGQTGNGYLSSSVQFGQTCQTVSLVCAFGTIRVGTAENPGEIAPSSVAQSCSVQPPIVCDSACGTVPHGENVTTFRDEFVPFGSGRTCESERIISQCNNGVLSPAGGNGCTCQVAPPVACTAPNGQTVAHEGSLTLYEFPRVQAVPGDGADTCVRQRRQCINGTFYDWNGNQASFTFTHQSCEVLPPASGGGPGGAGIPSE